MQIQYKCSKIQYKYSANTVESCDLVVQCWCAMDGVGLEVGSFVAELRWIINS